MRRRVSRFALALVLSAAVLLVVSPVEAGPARSLATPGYADDDGTPPTGPEELLEAQADAVAEARASGDPVVIDEMTTETTLVSAQPDGTMLSEISAKPARREVDGAWVDLDPTLVERDGAVRAKVGLGDLVISDGGPAESRLARYVVDGHQFEIFSPVTLPKPVLSGTLARYTDVLPGVDIVVDSSVAAFSYNWVIKSAEAADNPALSEIVMRVSAPELTPVEQHGGVSYVDADGVQVLWSPTPLMWDSSSVTTDDQAAADAGNPVQGSIAAVDGGPSMVDQVDTMSVTTTEDEVIMRPDMAALTGPDVVYPVVIDPSQGASRAVQGWTAVWDIYPNKSFWMTDHTLGAGFEGYEQNKKVRSYFKFAVDSFSGTKIVSAAMNVKQIHAASCSARSTQVYRSAAASSATTWNNQPTRYELQDSNSSTVACAGGAPAMVAWDVTTGVQYLADVDGSVGTFMIRAASETDEIAWKQFDDGGANLNVRWVGKPLKPTTVKIATANQSTLCTSPGTTYVVTSTSVTLRAIVWASGGGQTVRGVFTRHNSINGDDYVNVPGGDVPSGTEASYTWSGLTNGTTYRISAIARAFWSDNGGGILDSPQSDFCYFRVDTTAPLAPTVTSTAFNLCADADTNFTSCIAQRQGTEGVSGTVSVDIDDSQVTAYQYSLNGGSWTTVNTSAGAPQGISIVPSAGTNILQVRAYDGGSWGEAATVHFKVSDIAPVANWTFDGPTIGRNTANSSGQGNLTLGSANVDARGRDTNALALGGTGTPASTSTLGLSTAANFTLATWVHQDSDATAVFVSAPTSNGDAFELGYDAATQEWFAGRRSSSDIFTGVRAPGIAKAWTHLGASWNASTRKLSLFVNGRVAGSTTFTDANPVNTGGWVLGCGWVVSAYARCMNGRVDNVELFDRDLSAGMLDDLADPRDIDNNHALGMDASWLMADATDSTYDADLITDTGSTFGPSSDASLADVLRLTGGATQDVHINRPVQDTTGSFTVTALVKTLPGSGTTSGVIAQQRGVSGASWTLAYRANPGAGNQPGNGQGRWVFQVTSSDSASATVTEVKTAPYVDPTAGFVRIAGVYNGESDTIRLYLGNPTTGVLQLVDTVPADQAIGAKSFTSTWLAKSLLRVGGGTFDSTSAPWRGDIADLQIQAGAFG